MKCKYCGNNLGLEEEYCPHCGKPNEEAAKHIAGMKEYKEAYENVRKSVVKKNNRLNDRSARLVIIAVMVIIVAVLMILTKGYEDFETRQQKNDERIARELEKNRSTIDATLKEMESHRDYLAMDYYVLNYQLSHDSNYDSYVRVFSAATSYTVLYSDILGLVGDYDYFGERTNEDWCKDLAIYIASWNKYVEGEFWNDPPDSPMHAGEHGAFIADARKDIQDMIQVYFDLSDEQANAMWTMEEDDIAKMLYDKCKDIYPEAETDEKE